MNASSMCPDCYGFLQTDGSCDKCKNTKKSSVSRSTTSKSYESKIQKTRSSSQGSKRTGLFTSLFLDSRFDHFVTRYSIGPIYLFIVWLIILQFVIQEAALAKANFDAMSAGGTADWFTPLVYWPFCYFLVILGLRIVMEVVVAIVVIADNTKKDAD